MQIQSCIAALTTASRPETTSNFMHKIDTHQDITTLHHIGSKPFIRTGIKYTPCASGSIRAIHTQTNYVTGTPCG